MCFFLWGGVDGGGGGYIEKCDGYLILICVNELKMEV